ncbi:MAG: nitric oxide synthase [Candidatus Melainabacteria bacterium HGW-Melainabacteria-1]|nr:MAG: nitric oxide synthase [Candidatus Melainabacteria bacterium HGW-Melainabacteria-1]
MLTVNSFAREVKIAMKALVIYDSFFGNTAQIAEAIGKSLATGADVEVKPVGDVSPAQLQILQLLVIGSPTRGFRPTEAIQSFIEQLPRETLNGLATAAFDTRISGQAIKSSIFRFIVSHGGYAADTIAKALGKRGAEQLVLPEGFDVNGTEGPLAAGEYERAGRWGRLILNALKNVSAQQFHQQLHVMPVEQE